VPEIQHGAGVSGPPRGGLQWHRVDPPRQTPLRSDRGHEIEIAQRWPNGRPKGYRLEWPTSPPTWTSHPTIASAKYDAEDQRI
jgi:hypothetical protein